MICSFDWKIVCLIYSQFQNREDQLLFVARFSHRTYIMNSMRYYGLDSLLLINLENLLKLIINEHFPQLQGVFHE
jgi:hypothetical protein